MYERACCCDKAANHQLPVVVAFWIIQIVSQKNVQAKFDADSFLYLLRHFECDVHTVHMLTQRHVPPPLTSPVKLPMFMHVHSSPLSLAARLHRYHANHSHWITNGWTFSRPHVFWKTFKVFDHFLIGLFVFVIVELYAFFLCSRY